MRVRLYGDLGIGRVEQLYAAAGVINGRLVKDPEPGVDERGIGIAIVIGETDDIAPCTPQASISRRRQSRLRLEDGKTETWHIRDDARIWKD